MYAYTPKLIQQILNVRHMSTCRDTNSGVTWTNTCHIDAALGLLSCASQCRVNTSKTSVALQNLVSKWYDCVPSGNLAYGKWSTFFDDDDDDDDAN